MCPRPRDNFPVILSEPVRARTKFKFEFASIGFAFILVGHRKRCLLGPHCAPSDSGPMARTSKAGCSRTTRAPAVAPCFSEALAADKPVRDKPNCSDPRRRAGINPKSNVTTSERRARVSKKAHTDKIEDRNRAAFDMPAHFIDHSRYRAGRSRFCETANCAALPKSLGGHATTTNSTALAPGRI